MYEIDDYREVILKKIASQSTMRGYKSRMADAIGCQRSYLSRVLQDKAELSEEQGAALSLFWQLDPAETEYFLTLLQISRAGTKPLRDIFQRRLERLRGERREIAHRLSHSTVLDPQHQLLYYSSWLYPVLHIMVTIPELQTVSLLAEAMKMNVDDILKALYELEQMGLLIRQGDRWLSNNLDLHLKKNSPLTAIHHLIWRQRNSQKLLESPRDIRSYSGVHSLDQAKFETFVEAYLKLLELLRTLAAESRQESVVISFAADLGEIWSKARKN